LNLTRLSDKELIRRCLEGEKEAFQPLVLRYQDQVARTVISMLGPGQEAEDLGQEVFIRLFRSLEAFEGKSSLGTYITRIAINLSLNELKRKKRRNLFSLNDGEKNDYLLNLPGGEASEEDRAKQEWVQDALQQLEVKFRSVIVLRMMQGYSTKETADILNLPQGTVLSRLARGQEKLRIILHKLEQVNLSNHES